MNRVLLGAFIGFLFVSIIVPIVSVFGVNNYTQILSLYLSPITGASVAYYFETIKKEPEKNKEKSEEGTKKEPLLKIVKIETEDKVLKGTLVGIHGNTLVISKVRNMTTNETQDKAFIDLNKIKSLSIE